MLQMSQAESTELWTFRADEAWTCRRLGSPQSITEFLKVSPRGDCVWHLFSDCLTIYDAVLPSSPYVSKHIKLLKQKKKKKKEKKRKKRETLLFC